MIWFFAFLGFVGLILIVLDKHGNTVPDSVPTELANLGWVGALLCVIAIVAGGVKIYGL